jgi:hypothetical protein
VLGFLGYLNATYGYRTFDLVGYSYGGVIARATIAALKQAPPPGSMSLGFSYAQSAVGAGSIHVLSTGSHAREDAATWDATQPGVLDGVQVTLIAGDYCGRLCGDDRTAAVPRQRLELRTDGTVPVYSQLMLPCSSPCPAPPGSVYLPLGMVPNNVMRKTFPTVHSLGRVAWFHLTQDRSVTNNPEAIDYLVDTVAGTWRTAGTPMLTPSA